jgi:serine/threonine protein phosphatase PrpC
MVCPVCNRAALEGARFCEFDGAQLHFAPASAPVFAGCRCGAGADKIDAQGFCMECGRKCAEVPKPRDHMEQSLAPHFAAVTDRGKRHKRNEDDFKIALEGQADQPVYILVVCDGVSSSDDADKASDAGTMAAKDMLVAWAHESAVSPEEAVALAIEAAEGAVCALAPHGADVDPPESTIVAAVVREGVVTVGWLGDSRAYWISEAEAVQITHDHSWINDMVDSGQMSLEDASRSPQAHAITRCLGPLAEDEDPDDVTPTVSSYTPEGPGWLLVCSDGLWNYAEQLEDLAAMVRAGDRTDALGLARSLVQFALDQGGRDNITVALAALTAN